jgi:hypothetical protein
MDDIINFGGYAEVAVVDAMDEREVNSYIEKVVAEIKTVDISFNAIGLDAVQNIPLLALLFNKKTAI